MRDDPGIKVNVGRNGEVIFNNTAHHRLALSKITGLREIPAIVIVRHQQWEAIRRDKIKGNYDGFEGDIVKYKDHPNIPTTEDSGKR